MIYYQNVFIMKSLDETSSTFCWVTIYLKFQDEFKHVTKLSQGCKKGSKKIVELTDGN